MQEDVVSKEISFEWRSILQCVPLCLVSRRMHATIRHNLETTEKKNRRMILFVDLKMKLKGGSEDSEVEKKQLSTNASHSYTQPSIIKNFSIHQNHDMK